MICRKTEMTGGPADGIGTQILLSGQGRVQRRALSLGDSDDHVERTNV